MTTALYHLRTIQIGLSLPDLFLLDLGAVTDLFIEAGNDKEHYDEIATQEDIDNFFH